MITGIAPIAHKQMQITLHNAGKRYNREWIFRHCSHEFHSGKKYAITGPNGSGKSTLLQVIAGAITLNEGEISYILNKRSYPAEYFFRLMSVAGPYLELIEEMTAGEFLDFHQAFKELVLPVPQILEVIGLEKAADKQIRYYSSGMKQRLKLAQAFFSNTPVLFLDEPLTNLDASGISLYHRLIDEHSSEKLVIISSNDKQEYAFCDEVLSISDYK